MSVNASEADLVQIRVDRIERNPENPRLVFRPGELDDLMESIRTYGVQVPINVYREGKSYVLIDGERRWKCAFKLNHKTIPALVQKKPSPLENLLLMFNIHGLREQWDLLTIALKLPLVTQLLETESGKRPTEAALSQQTGLKQGIIRRCKLLMALPQRYKDQILSELRRPKSQQKFTEDFFIELERALTTVERALPEAIPDRDLVRRNLIRKFKDNVIKNRVEFRNIAKIARAKNVEADPEAALVELRKLFANNDYSIERAFENSVGEAYLERDLNTRVQRLIEILEDIDAEELELEAKENLEALLGRIQRVLNETL